MSATSAVAIPAVQFNITGFGEFHGVKDNPTAALVNSFAEYLQVNPLPVDVAIVTSLTVLETSGVGSRETLHAIREVHATPVTATIQTAVNANPDAAAPTDIAVASSSSSTIAAPAASSTPCHRVFLHFGVHAGSSQFALESTAYNCADFRCPDQRGWSPQNEPIHSTCAAASMCTDVDLPAVQSILQQAGWKVVVSTDPGRFVCNWIFFNSLHAVQGQCDEHSLFIHVPAHDVYDLPQQQMFAREAIIEIARSLQAGGKMQPADVAVVSQAESTHSH